MKTLQAINSHRLCLDIESVRDNNFDLLDFIILLSPQTTG